MPAEQPRRNAARPRQPDFALIGLDHIGSLAIGGIGEPRAHRIAERALLTLLTFAEISACRFVERGFETIGSELAERG